MGSLTDLPTRHRRETEPWASRAELADYLSVSLSTIDRWVNDGMPSRKFGRARRFKPTDAVKWLNEQAVLGGWTRAA